MRIRNYELRIRNYELGITNYELRITKISTVPHFDFGEGRNLPVLRVGLSFRPRSETILKLYPMGLKGLLNDDIAY